MACVRPPMHTHMHACIANTRDGEALSRYRVTDGQPLDKKKTTQCPWANKTSEHTRTPPPPPHRVIYEYGEERKSRSIARKIVAARLNKPIETTLELCRIIGACVCKSVNLGHLGHGSICLPL